jgi:transposase
MANQLKVADVLAIRALVERGWSYRRVARELGVHRETVARYARTEDVQTPKPAKAPTGSDPPGGVRNGDGSGSDRESEPATSAHRVAEGTGVPDTPGIMGVSASTRSDCEPHRELILGMLEQGLSAQRIWQDLRAEHSIDVSYYSVRRFIRHLCEASSLPFRRMECKPGEEAQLDFGRGAPVAGANGCRRRTWFFRIVLSHSRKGYTEAVFRQTTDELIRCLENAFDAFGGVPETLVFDNAKAAVIRPDWYDPELNPKLEAFCQHAGTVLLPTKPRTPRHKGKVESDVDYVKNNALKGRQFDSLAAQNEHLAHWEASVADTRIHGTTRRQVKQVFEEIERPTLKPLPDERFPFFQEATRIVHRDGHIEVAKAYYSLPPEYVGRTVWVRWDARLVRILDHRLNPVMVHARLEEGRFSTDPKHLHPHKVSAVERGAGHLLHRTRLIGQHTHAWAKAMLDSRGIEGVRVLVGLHSLAKRHSSSVLEDVCEIAHSHGVYRLRAIRQLIKRRGPKQDRFEFMDAHAIIRSLDEYTVAARRAIRQSNEGCVSPAMTTAARSNTASASDQDRSAGHGPGPQASPRKGLVSRPYDFIRR